MKKILIIALLAFMVSCGNNESSPEEVKKQIQDYKNQISEINDKIDKLEKTLEEQGVETKETAKLRVKSQTLTPGHFAHYVEASASLEAVNSAFISPEINGQVQTIHVREGDYVQKGQLLVSLNSDIIQSSIKELETSLELAKTSCVAVAPQFRLCCCPN